MKEAAIQDIPEINYQLWLIAIYHISWLAEYHRAQSVVFVPVSVSLFWLKNAGSAATDASEARNRDGSSCGRHFLDFFFLNTVRQACALGGKKALFSRGKLRPRGHMRPVNLFNLARRT